MKPLIVAIGLVVAALPLAAQSPAETKPSSAPSEDASGQTALTKTWGRAVDPDRDCKFKGDEKSLTITVPGSERPHDLSAELGNLNAPRTLKPVSGDFTFQVTVQGVFAPGDDSTQPGRTGYTGAGILMFVDPENYVRIERATLHGSGGEPHDYVNFEMRLDGKLVRIGTTGDRPITSKNPLHLRLERKGDLLHGFVSDDGQIWDEMEPKQVPETWPETAEVGVAAISTSRLPFEPVYTGLQLVSQPVITVPEPGTPPDAPAPAKAK